MPDSGSETARRSRRSFGLLLCVLGLALSFALGFWISLIASGAIDLKGNGDTLASSRPDAKSTAKDAVPELLHGRWQLFRDNGVAFRLAEERKAFAEKAEQILSSGYLDGSIPPPESTDVVLYDENAAYPGFNIYSSGHGTEVVLMDMEGKVLHTWRKTFEEVWPETPLGKRVQDSSFVRRFHAFPNGDILVLFRNCGLVKLDCHSQILWVYDGKVHHDLEVTKTGQIYVLLSEQSAVSEASPDRITRWDFVVTLDSEGREINRLSLLDAFEASPYRVLLQYMPKQGDLFHTNTVELLDGRWANRSGAFAAGNLLISVWTLDAIAVVDPRAKVVTWAQSGMWRKQHQPTVLDNGNLLILDNLGYKGYSQVIEYDPFSQEIAWTYAGDPPESFLTYTCGSCQRLPNGNTLITESDNGRAIEVTPDKTIVWEFLNPHRAGEGDMFIATLFDMIRLEPDFPIDWAENAHLLSNGSNQ